MKMKCPDCEEVFEDPEIDPLYECPGCGDVFLRSESESQNHRSPCCGKFSTKQGDYGCPNGCGVLLEEYDDDDEADDGDEDFSDPIDSEADLEEEAGD